MKERTLLACACVISALSSHGLEVKANPVQTAGSSSRCQSSETPAASRMEPINFPSFVSPYQRLADDAESYLISADMNGLLKVMHPYVLETVGKEQLCKIAKEEIIPFFKGAKKKSETSTICLAKGAKDLGFSFYRSFIGADGQQKPFVMAIVESKGQPKLFIVQVNLRFEDRYPDGKETIVVYKHLNQAQRQLSQSTSPNASDTGLHN